MKNQFSKILISSLLLVATAGAQTYSPPERPEFTDIIRSLEAAPIESPTLLYWDQMAADTIGLQTPRGRVGIPEFEDSVFKQLGFLIRENPTIIPQVVSTPPPAEPAKKGLKAFLSGIYLRMSGRPKPTPQAPPAPPRPSFVTLEVEYDAHGGSGRAGYVQVVGRDGKPSWVNIKGIGLTGVGNARGKVTGPPSKTRSSHSDGSAYEIEGMAEAVGGIVASNDLKYGGSRVIALIGTDAKIKFPDGVVHSLLIIVRTPDRRYDRALHQGGREMKTTEARIASGLGMAAARRIFKGDFVNQSNIGFGGAFIDYGKFSFVNGFVPGTNSEQSRMYREYAHILGQKPELISRYHYALGFYLLNQMGIEEARLAETLYHDVSARSSVERFAVAFRDLVESENSVADVVEQEKWNWKNAEGNLKLHFVFKEVAAALMNQSPNEQQDREIVLELLRRFTEKPSAKFPTQAESFATALVNLFRKATAGVQDPVAYAQAIRRVAEFKNREIWILSRPDMLSHFSNIAKDYEASPDPRKIQFAIDELVNKTRLSTGAFMSSQLAAHADEHAAYVDLKVAVEADGRHGLFAYPEMPLKNAGEVQHFQLSLDGGQSEQSLSARVVQTSRGPVYRLEIPHGQFPVTEQPILIRPSDYPQFEIKGPPLMMNERLGMLTDFQKTEGLLRTRYGVRTDFVNSDLREIKTAPSVIGLQCHRVFAD